MSFFKKIFTPKEVETRAALSKKVQTSPQDPQARQKLGLWLLQRGEVVEGIDQLARSAVLYEKGGFTGKAIGVLRHMIKQDPGNVDLQRWLIRMLAQQGHTGDAQRELERVVGGGVRFSSDEQKIDFLRQTAESLEKNPFPPLLIADVLVSGRKYYEAMNELDKAADRVVAAGLVPEFAKRMTAVVSRVGDNVELLETCAFLWLRAKRNEDGLQLLTRAAIVARRSGDAKRAGDMETVAEALRAGRAASVAGARNAAEAVGKLAAPPPPPVPVPEPETLRVEPPAGPAGAQAPGVQAAGGEPPATPASPAPPAPPAAGTPGTDQAEGPAGAPAPEEAARAREDRTIVRNVVEKLQAKVNEEIGDSDPEARYNLGIAYKEMGLLDEAMAEFRIARASRALFLGASCLLSETLAEKGDVDTALAMLDEVLASDLAGVNETRDVQYQKALLLGRSGRAEEGDGLMRAIFEKWPDYRDVRSRVRGGAR